MSELEAQHISGGDKPVGLVWSCFLCKTELAQCCLSVVCQARDRLADCYVCISSSTCSTTENILAPVTLDVPSMIYTKYFVLRSTYHIIPCTFYEVSVIPYARCRSVRPGRCVHVKSYLLFYHVMWHHTRRTVLVHVVSNEQYRCRAVPLPARCCRCRLLLRCCTAPSHFLSPLLHTAESCCRSTSLILVFHLSYVKAVLDNPVYCSSNSTSERHKCEDNTVRTQRPTSEVRLARNGALGKLNYIIPVMTIM